MRLCGTTLFPGIRRDPRTLDEQQNLRSLYMSDVLGLEDVEVNEFYNVAGKFVIADFIIVSRPSNLLQAHDLLCYTFC